MVVACPNSGPSMLMPQVTMDNLVESFHNGWVSYEVAMAAIDGFLIAYYEGWISYDEAHVKHLRQKRKEVLRAGPGESYIEPPRGRVSTTPAE